MSRLRRHNAANQRKRLMSRQNDKINRVPERDYGFRVLRPDGVLIFKWCEVEIPLESVLALTPERPLFGHRSGVKAATHWVAFVKT